MNWYKNIKIADDPLPAFEYPSEEAPDEVRDGFYDVDLSMMAEDAKIQEEKYPGLIYEGSGSWGVALAYNDDVIIKYTTDSTEYMSATEIIGMQKRMERVPGCVKVFSAEELKNGIYAIAMERLKPLNKEEKIYVYTIYSFLDKIYDENFRDEHIIALIKDRLETWTIGVHISTENPNFKDIYKKYTKMILDLKEFGADPADAHDDNIGKLPNGDYAMFDLGGLY